AGRRIPAGILIGSMSKSVWGGIRVGWIRAPAGLLRELLLHPLCAVCVPPPLEQLIACALLPQLDSLLRRRAAELRSQRDHLAELLRDDQTWSFTVPHGGLWLWLRLARTSGADLAPHAPPPRPPLPPPPPFP